MLENIVDVMDQFLFSRLLNVHTCLPGEIQEYYGHKERKAKVKPLVKMKTIKNENVEIQPIDGVPVIFPGSTKTHNTLYPLKKGDGVLLLFAENPIGNYLSGNSEVDSDDLTRFALTDCIAVPGLWSFSNIPQPVPENDNDYFFTFQNAAITIKDNTNDIEIKNNNTTITMSTAGSVTLETTTGKIEVDTVGNITMNNGTEPFVLGTTFDTWITAALLTVFNAHTHASPAGGNTGPPNAPLTPPIAYLSNRIKGSI